MNNHIDPFVTLLRAEGSRVPTSMLVDVVERWGARLRGAAVFVASDREFNTQFGDDYRGASDMADTMNECAARVRDQVLDVVCERMASGVADGESGAVALIGGLEALSSLSLGYYDRMAVRGALVALLDAVRSVLDAA